MTKRESDNEIIYVKRFVITNSADPKSKMAGTRLMTFPGQGRFTYETREQAEAALALHEPQIRQRVLGDLADTLRVCAVYCYPGHFDPISIVFDEDYDTSKDV